MAGGLRGNEPKGDIGDTGIIPSQEGIEKLIYNSLFTFRIEQEPLLLTDLAVILTAVTRLHTKLWLISHRGRLHSSRRLVEYMITDDSAVARAANLTVASITKNWPLTVVLVVSEALGKALASLIDAVSQTRIRYDKAKLELEQSRLAIAQQHAQIAMQLRQQAEAHDMGMLERRIQLQSQLLELDALERAQREAVFDGEIDRTHRLSEACMEVINQLHPEAEVETRQMFRQAVINNLLELFNYTGLVVESVKPRKSA